MTSKEHAEAVDAVFNSKYTGSLRLLTRKNLKWNTMAKVKCLQCNTIFTCRLDALKAGHGCRSCNSEKGLATYRKSKRFKEVYKEKSVAYTRTHKSHVDRVKLKHEKAIKVIGTYRNRSTKIEYLCTICNNTWNARPDGVESGSGCPECGKRKIGIANRKLDHLKLTTNPDYIKFRIDVVGLTNMVYARHKDKINPKKKTRAYHEFHIDHIYTVSEAFCNPKELNNPIKIHELCHPANLQMLEAKKNQKKSGVSHFSAGELRRRIREWNKQYGNPFVYRNEKLRVKG